ncbi:MAG: amino-acid N-acetyltransferase [Gammaproteobacteria bacterium]
MSSETPGNGTYGAAAWLRQVSPYFQEHRGKTFVVYLSGEALREGFVDGITRDISLLAAVGIRTVVVFGARPQIVAGLAAAGIASEIQSGVRVCDAATMDVVRQVVGSLRLDLEAKFSFSHRSGQIARVASGNFVVARPLGVIDGVDLGFSGQVRRVERTLIERQLAQGDIVLLPPLGYSPSGELFNLKGSTLAASIASELGAAKLILLDSAAGIARPEGGIHRQLTLTEARAVRDQFEHESFERNLADTAVRACQLGVARVHILPFAVDGALLAEVLTRDGIGTMISNAPFDQLREARLDDVGGIVDLVAPLERQGILVKRSREKLESEIDHFMVMVRENTVVACGALYPYPEHLSGELACIVVHPDYRGSSFGDTLIRALEARATETGLTSVFVLTTQATQWFTEQGYVVTGVDSLPVERKALYNFQRNSAVLTKMLVE